MVHASAQGLADSLNANETERNLLYPDVERVSLSLSPFYLLKLTNSLPFNRFVKYRSPSLSRLFVLLKSSESIVQKNSGQCRTRSSKSTFASKCTTLFSTPLNRPFLSSPPQNRDRARFCIFSFHSPPHQQIALSPSLSSFTFPLLLLVFCVFSGFSRGFFGRRISAKICVYLSILSYNEELREAQASTVSCKRVVQAVSSFFTQSDSSSSSSDSSSPLSDRSSCSFSPYSSSMSLTSSSSI